MDLAAFFDAVFLLGATASAAFLVYGGWLCRYRNGIAPAAQSADRESIGESPVDQRLSELSSSAALPLLAIVLALAAGISSSLA